MIGSWMVLLAALCAPAQTAGASIGIMIAGQPTPDERRGIELGIAEAAQTAKLLGRGVRIVTTQQDAAGVLVAGDPHARALRVPLIHLRTMPVPRTSCSFSVAHDGARDPDRALWHASLYRYGAGELNERYARAFGRPMSEEAYAGWVAVKAVVEAALRGGRDRRSCDALARLRFDGHKGRPLAFDAATGVLEQPLYVVKNGKVVGERR